MLIFGSFLLNLRSQLSLPLLWEAPHPQTMLGEAPHGLFLCLRVLITALLTHAVTISSCVICPHRTVGTLRVGASCVPVTNMSPVPSTGPSTQRVLSKNLATNHSRHPRPAPSSPTWARAVASTLVSQLLSCPPSLSSLQKPSEGDCEHLSQVLSPFGPQPSRASTSFGVKARVLPEAHMALHNLPPSTSHPHLLPCSTTHPAAATRASSLFLHRTRHGPAPRPCTCCSEMCFPQIFAWFTLTSFR